ncbi:MAG: sensor histidine kinase, partial [Pseudonocardiaceae bacterium]
CYSTQCHSPCRRLSNTRQMRVTGDRAAVPAAALVWLVMLAFPVAYALSGTVPVAQLSVSLAALALLVGIYLHAVIRIARQGAPQPAPLSVVTVAVIALGLPLVAGTAWFGGTVFLAALLGLSLPARPALAGIAVTTGLATAQALLTEVGSPQSVSIPLVTAVAGIVVVAVVHQATLSRELGASRRSAERLAADAERLRLARELHDSVKQHAFVAALELASARSRLGPDEHLDAAAEAVATVQRQLGAVIEHVRPPQRELVPALREHLAGWSQRTGVAADLAVRAGEHLPAEPLLLVAVEALTNVARHAGAHRVAITLSGTPTEAELEMTDDGHGFDPAQTPPGQGLRGMRERLAERGGTLDVRSGRGGTTVTARYPAAQL